MINPSIHRKKLFAALGKIVDFIGDFVDATLCKDMAEIGIDRQNLEQCILLIIRRL